MIYIPSHSEEDWKQFLAEPDKQWKDGFSAKSLAVAWHTANGLPLSVVQAFKNSHNEIFKDLEMIFGIPEYKVSLPGGERASQNDLFVLARNCTELIPIMVEGKVNESFGPLVSDWSKDMSKGKQTRLQYLVDLLNLQTKNINNIRYQLLHRTASAIITAEKYHCKTALVLIHSFSDKNKSFDDFSDFVNLYNLSPIVDGIVGPVSLNNINVYFGWVNGS